MSGLHKRIREARRHAGMTRTELARRVRVQPSAATQWEHENGTAPTVRNLIRIATLTSVSFEWLATGRGVPHPKHLTEIRDARDFARDPFEEEMLELAREM